MCEYHLVVCVSNMDVQYVNSGMTSHLFHTSKMFTTSVKKKPIYMSNEVSACMDPVLRKFEAFRRRHTKIRVVT